MCKVYNQVGCLTEIDTHLRKHQISQYKTLDDLMGFQRSYPLVRHQIILEHQVIIEEEKINLQTEIEILESSIETKMSEVTNRLSQNISDLKNNLSNQPSTPPKTVRNLLIILKKTWLRFKIWFYQIMFNLIVWYNLRSLYKVYRSKTQRHQYIISQFDDSVLKSASVQLFAVDKTNSLIKQIENSIYGAMGELRVQNELEKLSDDYILINDFKIEFGKTLYNKKEHDHIKTAQIDHLLISPAGIFIIETKNWSKQSLNNSSLRSPVVQIKRANYAMHALLNWDKSVIRKIVRWHHWGDKKIPVRNLIVFIDHKPNEEFEYVKIETVNRILGYIKYFKPCFSVPETEAIGDYLNKLCGQVMTR